MEQTRPPHMSVRGLLRGPRWSVAAITVAILLVFTGAAFAQATQPQTNTQTDTQADTPTAPQPEPGLVVVHVMADSPAAAAGVVRGDIITAVDGDAVNTMPELSHVIMSHKAGDVITLTVMHGDEERSLPVTLGDNNGKPELGVMALGDMSIEMKMKNRGMPMFDHPSNNGRGQGRVPGRPFGRGMMPDMPNMPGMPFGQGGEGMMFMDIMQDGALVVDVMEESGAAAAGIQAGDVITAVDGTAVANGDELISLLGDHKPGDVITVAYLRGDESAIAEVTLGEHPDDATRAYMGIQLAPADAVRMRIGQGMMPDMPNMPGRPEMRMMPGMPGQEVSSGALILAVTEDGPAATAGLKAGDMISAVDGVAIDTPQALVDAVNAAKAGDEMVLTIKSMDSAETIDVTVTLGENADGGALLGVQIGNVHMFFGPGNGNGQENGNGHRNGNGNGNGNGWRFQAPGQRQQPAQPAQPAKPDARFSPQPDFAGESA